MTKKQIDEIVRSVGTNFRTFGGGQRVEGNPIAEALKNQPYSFAAGVDVHSVVLHVLKLAKKKSFQSKSKHLKQ